jgi:hypothetical protein
MLAPLKFKAIVPTVFGKLLLLLLAASYLRVRCTYCLVVIGDISLFPAYLSPNPNQLRLWMKPPDCRKNRVSELSWRDRETGFFAKFFDETVKLSEKPGF